MRITETNNKLIVKLQQLNIGDVFKIANPDLNIGEYYLIIDISRVSLEEPYLYTYVLNLSTNTLDELCNTLSVSKYVLPLKIQGNN